MPFSASFFFIFVFSTQLTVNKCLIKVCQCLDSNHGSLVSEATTVPIEPQPLPFLFVFSSNRTSILVVSIRVVICLFSVFPSNNSFLQQTSVKNYPSSARIRTYDLCVVMYCSYLSRAGMEHRLALMTNSIKCWMQLFPTSSIHYQRNIYHEWN